MPRMTFYYGTVSLLCFLASSIGFEVLASVVLTTTPVPTAIRESVFYFIAEPVGSLLLSLPFFAIGLASVVLEKTVGSRQARAVFVCFMLALGALYLSGYWAAQEALLQHKWTAASLAVGSLPLKSLVVLVVVAVVAGLLLWKTERARA